MVEFDLPIRATEGAKAYLTIVAANVAKEVDWTEEMTGRKADALQLRTVHLVSSIRSAEPSVRPK